MKTLDVTTQDLGIVTVHKLALGDYAELLKSLKKLPAEIMKMVQGTEAGKLQKITLEQLIDWVPQLMEMAPDEIMHIIALSTDKTDEEVSKSLDLADAIEIFDAILQLNDYRRIATAVKKMQARVKNPPAETPNPS